MFNVSLSNAYAECEACKVDGRAECETRRHECGQEKVAAVAGAAEALVRAVPRAVGRADALGLAHHVVPQHLKTSTNIILSICIRNESM